MPRASISGASHGVGRGVGHGVGRAAADSPRDGAAALGEDAGFDASDEDQVEAAKLKAGRTRAIEVADLRAVLGAPEGRRMMWRYLTRCGVFKTSMTGSSQTFFLEGQRNVGLWLLADINAADPGAYIKMLSESQEGG